MSTSKFFAADEESVLMAFSMEPSHGRETLERYVREYPQHATALIDCSIDLLYEVPESDVPAIEVPDSAVDKAWQRFERAVQQTDAEVANPFTKLNTSSFKSLARSLDVSNLFLMRVRDRAIHHSCPIRREACVRTGGHRSNCERIPAGATGHGFRTRFSVKCEAGCRRADHVRPSCRDVTTLAGTAGDAEGIVGLTDGRH